MIPTLGAVIPSAVGVDIGCGMVAAELFVTEDQLPDDIEPLLGRIERAVPAGVGKGHEKAGTLGSGNHFFELCVDERSRVWVVLHSGSRGIGNQLAQMHIANAFGTSSSLQYPVPPERAHLGRDHPAGEVLRLRTLAS